MHANAALGITPRSIVHGPSWRAVALAVFVTVLMLSGGFVLFGSGGSRAAPPTAPIHPFSTVSSTQVLSGQQLQQAPVQTLAGAPLTQLPNATVLGPAPSAQPITFTVGFPMRNEAQLAAIISEQSTPGSPMYQRPLTLAQENEMFGADPVEVQNTINYFTSLGFQVQTVGSLSVSFRAPVSSVDGAFHTQMSQILYGNPTAPISTVGNTQPLTLPGPIANGIAGVDGLSGTNQFHPYHSINPQAAELLASAGAPSAIRPAATASLQVLWNYTNQAFAYFSYYSHVRGIWYRWSDVTAPAFNHLYGADPLLNLGYNGNNSTHDIGPNSPITIAIVMAGGINPDDLRAYSQLVYNNPNQIMGRLIPTPVDGAFILNGSLYYTDGDSNEMALDIEFSSTMAPGARIMPVYGPSLLNTYLDDDYATLQGMATVPNIISNSWGGDEDTQGTLYSPGTGNDLTMHHYFMLLTARGASVIASSGDGGGFDSGSGILAASFPAGDPYVMSVDGLRTVAADPFGNWLPTDNATYGSFQTDLQELGVRGINMNMWVARAASIHNQSYWYEPITNLSLYTGPPSGSGGFGFSYWFDQPYWEHGIGVPNVGRSLGSGVAAEGDFNMSIFFDGVFTYLFGGTSFACPTVAGELADILDYLQSGQGVHHQPYLFNVNQAVFDVGNAWWNGNLTLNPFYDVLNGTSFWGNHGAQYGYSWPPGQNFPTTASGSITYGDTLPGWDFPTGWGSINVYNFAIDLDNLLSEPGQFMTVNGTSNMFAPLVWQKLTLNQSYTIDVNTTAGIAAANPTVIAKFFPQTMTGVQGPPVSFVLPTTLVASPALGLRFTLDTRAAPFAPAYLPGVVIFTLGDTQALPNNANKNLGFAYDWVGPAPASGNLTVTVVTPNRGSIVGGCADANMVYPLFGFDPPFSNPGLGCVSVLNPTVRNGFGVLYQNTFTVRVTDARGNPVYNALVNAQIPSLTDLAWAYSTAEVQSSYLGRVHTVTSTIVSQTFTNLTGYALVYTWNMVRPTPYFVNATYGLQTGGTVFTVTTGPNVAPWDVGAGKYSQLNGISIIQYVYRTQTDNQTLNAWVPNSVNQSGLYNMMYGWQGERITVRVNDYTGSTMGSVPVWLGTYDIGHEYKFTRYNPSGGIVGVTNSSGTTNLTDSQGFATLQIPDNMSTTNFWGHFNVGLGIAAIAANITSASNRTFQYVEKCSPTLPNPSLLINCEFNNSYERSYSATPIMILPNPVNVTTMTDQRVSRDFFGGGQTIGFRVNLSLPTLNPEFQYIFGGLPYGNEWPAGLEHVTSISAWVDNHFAMNLTPQTPPNIQVWSEFANLSGGFTPGLHNLTVVVTTSLGQTFTNTHRFIIGSIIDENLNQNVAYLKIPFNLTWAVNIPQRQISNVTFNSSLQILYLTPCNGQAFCQVVNYSIRVNPHQVSYNQSINETLLQSAGFYSGAGRLPQQNQYEVRIWFSANHSGSIVKSVDTYFVFDPLQGVINGPTANSVVPLGQTTISYTYTGAYLTNASVEVWQRNLSSGAPPVLVFSQGAFIPGVGGEPRSGVANWTSVAVGTYEVKLILGAPYANYTSTELFNVTNPNPLTTITPEGPPKPLIPLTPATLSLILALVAGIVGVLVGLWVAPTLRPSGEGRPGGPKEWESGKAGSGPTSGGSVEPKSECPICHERFETAFGLHQHQKVVHGIEE